MVESYLDALFFHFVHAAGSKDAVKSQDSSTDIDCYS